MFENQSHHTSRASRARSDGDTRAWTRTSRAKSRTMSTTRLTTTSKSQPKSSKLSESTPLKSRLPEPTPTSCLKNCAGPAAQIMAPGDTAISISTSFQIVIPQRPPMTEMSTSVTLSSTSRSGNAVQITTFNATIQGASASQTSLMISTSSEDASTLAPSSSFTSSATTASSEPSQSTIPIANANSAATSSNLIKKMSIDAKVGAMIGLVMLFLPIAVLSILFCTRKRRRLRVQAAKLPSIDPQSIFHTPVFYNRNTNNNPNTPDRISLDSAGIRWPEKVQLSGDAKEINDLTKEFDHEYKSRRPLSCQKKGEESQIVIGRIEIGHLKPKKLGGSW